MFCKNCGKKLEEGAAFCPYCGTEYGKRNVVSDVSEKETVQTLPQEKQALYKVFAGSKEDAHKKVVMGRVITILGALLFLFFTAGVLNLSSDEALGSAIFFMVLGLSFVLDGIYVVASGKALEKNRLVLNGEKVSLDTYKWVNLWGQNPFKKETYVLNLADIEQARCETHDQRGVGLLVLVSKGREYRLYVEHAQEAAESICVFRE